MSQKQLEAKYTLFDSLDKMLSPDALSELLSEPVASVCHQPIAGHSGLAGGQLSCVDTDAGQLVLKRMSILSDWIMFASDDRLCRSVTLWQYGVLDRLLPHLEHKIIACSRDGDGWAILMEDLSGKFGAWNQPISRWLISIYLEALARLHATFWDDPVLNDPRLGLCDPAQLLDQSSLPMAQKHPNSSMGVLPEWVTGGWEVMGDLLEPDVFAHMHSLTEDPQPLIKALGRYPKTLLHGDYRSENLAYSDHPIAIDWQESAHSLMTIDLAWFAHHGYVDDAIGRDKAIRYYRQHLEAHLNKRFDDTQWQMMLDLGTLVDALRSTCFAAYGSKHDVNPKDRRWNELAVKKRNQQVREALRWL